MPLPVHVPKRSELWNEEKGKFETIEAQTLVIEHSLVSISKWESKWHKAFLEETTRTKEELLDYIRCMTLNIEEVDERVFSFITSENLAEIKAYLEDPMTATWINEKKTPAKHRIITSELIYYWMFTLQIDKSCENWPLQRLIMLIRIFEEEQEASKKKTTMNQRYARHNALNKARRRPRKAR